MNQLNRTLVEFQCWLLVTLTYPCVFPDPKAAKRHLRIFQKRLDRAWGHVAGFWKLEPQKRGAPHFHLLLCMAKTLDVEAFTTWVAEHWTDVVSAEGIEREKMRRWHLGGCGHGNRPCVERVKTWNGVMAYAAKYVGKICKLDGWKWPGRIWGEWHADLLPRTIHREQIDKAVAHVLRRQLIRWYEHQGSGVFRFERAGYMRNDGTGEFIYRWIERLHRSRYKEKKDFEFVVDNYKKQGVVREQHRRWRGKGGGCTMFIAVAAFQRLYHFAKASVTSKIQKSEGRSPLHNSVVDNGRQRS
ncbi:MAG: hypothetical protein M3O30_18875 [Planctomycetota bacterium]|nr:hypothetical protein [Planctomycetota bacterium]